MIAAQIERVRAELETRPSGLISHVGRVLTEAISLAKAWDLDPLRVELAVWGHDLFRADAETLLLKRARGRRLALTDADINSPVLLHGPLAALELSRSFGVDDDEVLSAVRDHTLGRESMSDLAKVILLADKVEAAKRRSEQELEAIRLLAARDLDLALLCWSDRKLLIERHEGWPSDERHWRTRTAWVSAHHSSLTG